VSSGALCAVRRDLPQQFVADGVPDVSLTIFKSVQGRDEQQRRPSRSAACPGRGHGLLDAVLEQHAGWPGRFSESWNRLADELRLHGFRSVPRPHGQAPAADCVVRAQVAASRPLALSCRSVHCSRRATSIMSCAGLPSRTCPSQLRESVVLVLGPLTPTALSRRFALRPKTARRYGLAYSVLYDVVVVDDEDQVGRVVIRRAEVGLAVAGRPNLGGPLVSLERPLAACWMPHPISL